MKTTALRAARLVPVAVGTPAAAPAGTVRRPVGKRARIAARATPPRPMSPARLARRSASLQARVSAIAGSSRPATPAVAPTASGTRALRVAGKRPPPAYEYVVVRRTDEQRARARHAAVIAAIYPR